MIEIGAAADLPARPAVYALYGGRGRGLHVAYVGSARDLRTRLTQHLVLRNSSVTTGASVVALNADLVTEARWWEQPDFSDEARLLAAELVAFDVLNPALRSRGQPREDARLLAADVQFRGATTQRFTGEPTGRLVIPSLRDALERIAALEERVRALEAEAHTRNSRK
ncbi:MAG: hypothetical protein ACRDID_07990 [Ktedonobacterales bacterium]